MMDLTEPIELLIYDLDDTLFDTTGQLSKNPESLDQITLFPNTLRVLTSIPCKKALVSKGCEARQNKKIEQLDIRHYFWRIELCKTGADKKKAFVKLIEEAGLCKTPKRVMVVGNRLDEEIKYGNMLGCQTVHLIHGKYADRVPTHLHENPTYQIHEIGELALLVTAHTS